MNSTVLVGNTCMELALEGERLCKSGDFKNGVGYFEEAINVGTTDDRTLSAIYSQLGNAYFYMEDYQRALEYHQKDVSLVHSIGDQAAEAKACGNLGNTFKMLAKFDEAALYCRRYLEISKKLNDSVGQGRALYNLGNVYHTQGKRMIGASEQEPGELSNDIKSSLLKAVEYYEMNLEVVSELKDYASMGRAYGNLGNTHYLLGNFEQAVASHRQRLELARQTNDKSAERRAHLNLGNANVFLGNFTEAIENYSATLRIAQDLQDKFTEAHSCYSLANTYTFLRDYKSAINYHLKYLEMIKEFDDKLGEGRACWSLVNIYQMVNEPESALIYAKRHQRIAELLGDRAGLASAKLNIEELDEIISQKQAAQLARSSQQHHTSELRSNLDGGPTVLDQYPKSGSVFRLTPDKRQDQEQRRFKKQLNSNLSVDIDGLASRRKARPNDREPVKSSSNERLFDMIAHFQSGRIDDQRCEMLKKPAGSSSIVGGQPVRPDEKENDDAVHEGSDNFTSAKSMRERSTRASQPTIGNPLSAVSSAIKATYRKASSVTAHHHMIGGDSQDSAMTYPKGSLLLSEISRQKSRSNSTAGLGTTTTNADLDNTENSTQPNEAPQSSTRSIQRASARRATEFSLPDGKARQFASDSLSVFRLSPDKRQDQEQNRFKKHLNTHMSVDFVNQPSHIPRDGHHHHQTTASRPVRSNSSEQLLEMIAHFQSGRIDDQRCEILKNNQSKLNRVTKTSFADDKENLTNSNPSVSPDSIGASVKSCEGAQSRSSQPSIGNPLNVLSSAIKATYRKASLVNYPSTVTAPLSLQSQRRPTVSAQHQEELFNLIAGAQRQRMDEQRASLPLNKNNF